MRLEKLGRRERHMMIEILKEWDLPDEFYDDQVRFEFNPYSGYLFLINAAYQVCMINPATGKLEMFYSTPNSGHEGFVDDLFDEIDKHWDTEDVVFVHEKRIEKHKDKLEELVFFITQAVDLRKTDIQDILQGYELTPLEIETYQLEGLVEFMNSEYMRATLPETQKEICGISFVLTD